MPPASVVPVDLAVKVLKKYIAHFANDELPPWNSEIWKKIANDPELKKKWTIASVRTNIREDRRGILSEARRQCGISVNISSNRKSSINENCDISQESDAGCAESYLNIESDSEDNDIYKHRRFSHNLEPLVYKGRKDTITVCIKCHIKLESNQQNNEYYAVDLSGDLVSIVEKWCGREIADNDRLCQECMQLVIQEAFNGLENPQSTSNQQLRMNECVCVSCGISLHRHTGRQHQRLLENTAEWNYLQNQIFPRQMPTVTWTCMACWTRAHKNIFPSPSLDSGPEHIEPEPVGQVARITTKIELPNYKRASASENLCFVPGCVNLERLRVPIYLRRLILSQYKIYLSKNSRMCREHSTLLNWDILNEHKFKSSFSAQQIENMFNLLKTAPAAYVT